MTRSERDDALDAHEHVLACWGEVAKSNRRALQRRTIERKKKVKRGGQSRATRS